MIFITHIDINKIGEDKSWMFELKFTHISLPNVQIVMRLVISSLLWA